MLWYAGWWWIARRCSIAIPKAFSLCYLYTEYSQDPSISTSSPSLFSSFILSACISSSFTNSSPTFSLSPAFSRFRTNFPLASTLPSAGRTLTPVKRYPSAPPLPVIKGCVLPGKTCHSLTLALCTLAFNTSVGLRGKSSSPVHLAFSSSVIKEEKEEGGDWINAVRREVEYRSESVTRGSIVGEYMTIGAPPRNRGIVRRRMDSGDIEEAIARPSKFPANVESTINFVLL